MASAPFSTAARTQSQSPAGASTSGRRSLAWGVVAGELVAEGGIKRRCRTSGNVGVGASAGLRFLHVFAEEGDELFCAEALIALHVADDANLARGGAIAEGFDNEF